MAIGDVVIQDLGTAAESYQPASGVEAEVSCMVKPASTDRFQYYDGSNVVDIIADGIVTDQAVEDATQFWGNAFNVSIMLTNSQYLHKNGTTDRYSFSGVITNV